MSSYAPSKAPVPASHKKMLADAIAKGWIKPVGDSYEITDKGHEYTVALTAELQRRTAELIATAPSTVTPEGIDPVKWSYRWR